MVVLQRYFRLSHRGNSLYRGHIWSDLRMITQEPALPRFGKKHSGRGHSKCKGHEVGTSMTFWGTEGGSMWLEFGECQGDVYGVVGRSQIVLVGLAHLSCDLLQPMLRDICGLICPCYPSVTSRTLSSIIFLHINIQFSQPNAKSSSSWTECSHLQILQCFCISVCMFVCVCEYVLCK